MGNWKSAWCGDSEEQKTEMKMDGSEPVNLREKKRKPNGRTGTANTDDDVSPILWNKIVMKINNF